MLDQTYLTKRGLAKLQKELGGLIERRRTVAEQIREASEVGGNVDNAEYDVAKDDQSQVEGRILQIENIMKAAIIIRRAGISKDAVHVGCKVTVRMEQGTNRQYTIVGSTEADPGKGTISNVSPVGKCLLGSRIGDEVEATVPIGKLRMKVLKIQ